MLRYLTTILLLAMVPFASAQAPDDAHERQALSSRIQSWDDARYNTYLLGQRRRSSGTIVSAVGAGILSFGAAASLGGPAVVLGGAFVLVGGIQSISGSAKVLKAIDNNQPPLAQTDQQSATSEAKASLSWKPEVGVVVFFERDEEVLEGRVLKANMDETQFRVEYTQTGKTKRKWMFGRSLYEVPTSVMQ